MSQDLTFPRLYKSQAGFLQAMEIHKAYESRISVPFETKYIETSSGKTYIRTAGPLTGEPVFLWHGLGGSGGLWHHQINDLASEYRLFIPDIIGSMGKSASTRLQRTGPAYGKWVSQVMDGVNVSSAHHIGISYGGWIILKLATADFNRTVSATLISPAGFANRDWKLLLRGLPAVFARRSRRAYRFARMMSPPNFEQMNYLFRHLK